MEMVMVWQWEIVVPCRILGRNWRKGTASWKPVLLRMKQAS